MKQHKRGFTLIELLVVVLIIAVLAAIAVPQYQKAIELARLAEVKQFVHTATNAIDAYLLSRGGYPQPPWCGGCVNFDFMGPNHGGQQVLDVDLQKGLNCTAKSASMCASKYFMYDASCNESSCAILANRYTGKDMKTNNPELRYKLVITKSAATNNHWTYRCGGGIAMTPLDSKICNAFVQSMQES